MGDNQWILLVLLGAIVLLFTLLRKKGNVRKYPEIVQAVLFEVKLNQSLADYFSRNDKYRRFEYVNWEMNKDKIGFLSDSLKQMLKEAFTLAKEFNDKIKQAKKAKDHSHKNIDLARLKELLAICREELENWMVEKTGKKELPPRYPTLMDTFFGER